MTQIEHIQVHHFHIQYEAKLYYFQIFKDSYDISRQ